MLQSFSGVKLLEWRHQVQKEELKRSVVGLQFYLCRQGQNYLSGEWGHQELCVEMVARPFG